VIITNECPLPAFHSVSPASFQRASSTRGVTATGVSPPTQAPWHRAICNRLRDISGTSIAIVLLHTLECVLQASRYSRRYVEFGKFRDKCDNYFNYQYFSM